MNSRQLKPVSVSQSGWRDQLKEAYRRPHELLEALAIDPDAVTVLTDAPFPMRVPKAFAQRMRPNDLNDPLLKQVLPLMDERRAVEGFCRDPVGDRQARQVRGLLHKYHGRALLITTGACAIHCRYCFRQHFPYATEHTGGAFSSEAIDHIASDPSISEVILSGGDPLMLPTAGLKQLSERLADIKHIKRFRIHTRLPVVLPDRVTPNLVDWLHHLPWPVVVVVHANHAQEFDEHVDHALGLIKDTGATILNQAVLLRGINDALDDLVALMERSFSAGALPYYLHQLDRVAGSAHFEVPTTVGLNLMDELRTKLSGYLVPKFVKETARAPYKVPLL